MSEVFISFIHQERRAASAMFEVLRGCLSDTTVFLSSADDYLLFAGDVWLDEIRSELTEAKVVLLMLSGESVQRPWINFEAGAAWLTGKTIIPACYGGLTKSTMPKPYSGIQGVDLPDDLTYLVRSIQHHLDPIAPRPPLFHSGTRGYKTIEAGIRGEQYFPDSLLVPWGWTPESES